MSAVSERGQGCLYMLSGIALVTFHTARDCCRRCGLTVSLEYQRSSLIILPASQWVTFTGQCSVCVGTAQHLVIVWDMSRCKGLWNWNQVYQSRCPNVTAGEVLCYYDTQKHGQCTNQPNYPLVRFQKALLICHCSGWTKIVVDGGKPFWKLTPVLCCTDLHCIAMHVGRSNPMTHN